MSLESQQDHWLRICRGELCQLCEAPLPDTEAKKAAYCSSCAPTPALRPHPVYVHIDHHVDGWSVHINVPEASLVYWMVRLSNEGLHRLMRRLRLSPTARMQHPHALRTWGRNSLHAHLNRRQARIFVWACRRDRRTGYEKLRGWPDDARLRRH